MSYLEELLPECRKGAKIRLKFWNKTTYIHFKENRVLDDKDQGFQFNNTLLTHKDWEFYQEPIDYNYIIKNKCLCYFGDVKDDMKIGVLGDVCNECSERFHPIDSLEDYEHCRPVRRDEVTFYEDRKDD